MQRLSDARDEAAHAVAGLDKAAAEALQLVAEYSAVVREVSAELVSAGLRAGDSGEDGGTAGGAVHLDGETWRAADPLGVLEYLLAVRVAAENPAHPLAMRRYSTESLAGKAAREDLLRAAERVTAPYAEAYGAGGPEDDGVGAAVWLALQRCAAVEETRQAARDRTPGGVLAALLASLGGPAD